MDEVDQETQKSIELAAGRLKIHGVNCNCAFCTISRSLLVEAEKTKLLSGRLNAARESLRDKLAWLKFKNEHGPKKHQLPDEVYPRNQHPNGYCAILFPDWDVRQKIQELEADLDDAPKAAAAVDPEAERNWTEDAALDNGSYQSVCINCEKSFIGHKRRLSCRLCCEGPRPVSDDKR